MKNALKSVSLIATLAVVGGASTWSPTEAALVAPSFFRPADGLWCELAKDKNYSTPTYMCTKFDDEPVESDIDVVSKFLNGKTIYSMKLGNIVSGEIKIRSAEYNWVIQFNN